MDVAFKAGTVKEILFESEQRQDIVIVTDSGSARAINLLELTGPCQVGDTVTINTTAVDLNLGTGGWHFVMAVYGRSVSLHGSGHIMKVRYTPVQGRVHSVEEEDSPYHHVFQGDYTLEGMPAAVGTLHSMLAPFAFAFRHCCPDKRLIYLMSDGAALPLSLSKIVPILKERGLIDEVVTFGHAFGGDREAVNIFSVLLAARHVCRGDAAVVLMGPGVVGTSTKWGTTALEQGYYLNAVQALKGVPVALVRMSEADKRPRHFGISHHTMTVLQDLAHPGCVVPLPERLAERDDCLSVVKERHNLVFVNTEELFSTMLESGLELSTMGRTPHEDALFFHAALAGGCVAAHYAKQRGNHESRS